MKSGRTLVSLAQELERQLHSKKDLIVPSQLVHHSTGDDGHASSPDTFQPPPSGGIWAVSGPVSRQFPLQNGGISWSAVRRAEKTKPLISSTKSGAYGAS